MSLMLFVDVCGDTVPFFSHAKWHGLHLADFVMPGFIFILGAGVALGSGGSWLYRAIRMFVLGVVVQGSWFPDGLDLTHFRLMGILQRLAVCGLCVSGVCKRGWTLQWSVVFVCLNIQIFIYTFLTVPECAGPGDFSIECNAQSWIDRLVIGSGHMYKPMYDPEGLVATLGCLLPCMTGYTAVVHRRTTRFSTLIAISIGLILAGISIAWMTSVPFNKALWTLPYNLATTGTCLCVFGIIDLVNINPTSILVHLGSNAILFFVLSDCCAVARLLINSVYVTRDGKPFGIVDWFLNNVLHVETYPDNILIYATVQLIFYFIVTGMLYRRRIFYKI